MTRGKGIGLSGREHGARQSIDDAIATTGMHSPYQVKQLIGYFYLPDFRINPVILFIRQTELPRGCLLGGRVAN
jgi:hypothetical protein